jgi:Iron-containing redox enzyme
VQNRVMQDLTLERIPAREPALREPGAVPADSVEHLLGLCLRGPVDHRGTRDEHRALLTALSDRLSRGYLEHDEAALLDVHRSAHAIYELLLGHPLSNAVRHERSAWLGEFRWTFEEQVLTADLAEVAMRLPAAGTPMSAAEVCDWFVAEAASLSSLDTAVERYLAEHATLDQMAQFIRADGYLNYRFYDALALVQPHFMETVKNELSHHMWDECGEGERSQAHTLQFSRSLRRLGLDLPAVPMWEDWRPFAGQNLYFMLGFNRQHYFKALGSLAMPELFDVDRDAAVVRGLERLGFVARTDFEFFSNHMEGDAEHGREWLDGVVSPIVDVEPGAARDLMAGGALRMLAMRRYNEYLASGIGLVGTEAIR